MSADNLFDNLNFDPKNMQTTKNNSAEIQNQMMAMQKMLGSITAEGSAGIEGYTVKICLNGRHEALKVEIDPQLLTKPVQLLEGVLASAITDAAHKIEIAIQQQMVGLLKNFKLPG